VDQHVALPAEGLPVRYVKPEFWIACIWFDVMGSKAAFVLLALPLTVLADVAVSR